MIDDFRDKPPRKPPQKKRIEPLEKPPQKSIHELAAEHDAQAFAAPSHGSPAHVASSSETPQPPFTPAVTGSPTPHASPISEPAASSHPAVSPARPKTHFLSPRWTLNKKWTMVSALVAVLLVGGAAGLAYAHRPKDQGGTSYTKAKFVPKETRVPSTLSGLLVDPSVNQRPVTGVMIENSEDARPQSGLSDASVVFEAIAEGGITRFLALFQDTQPDYIGPVRSARPYYVQWCMGFDCALAHAGGSPEALQNIKDWGTKDLNDTPGIFWRITGRYAPHNLYSSIAKLNELENSKGYGAPTFTGLSRKKDAPFKTPAAPPSPTVATKTPPPAADPRTPAASLDLAISSPAFNSHLDYDPSTNTYKRSQAGAPHLVTNAAGAQTPITPKVVVALIMQYGIASDKHSQYGVIGTGQAFIFQDGTVTEATWNKADTTAPLRLTDAAGKDIPLNAGQTWFTALSAPNLITYR